MTTAQPESRVITQAMALYRQILRLGSDDFQRDYTEVALQLFRDCCREAYQKHGPIGVMALLPSLFFQAFTDMLADRFAPERMSMMLPTLRRSMISTMIAFLLFAVAYLGLLHVIDPLPPFLALAQQHGDLALAYSTIRNGANVTALTMAIGILIVFLAIIKQAVRGEQPIVRKLLLRALLITMLVVIGTLILLRLPQAIVIHPVMQIAIIMFWGSCLIADVIVCAQIVLHSEFHTQVLRLVMIVMAIAIIAMAVSMLATLIWIIRLWADAPAYAASQGFQAQAAFNLSFGGIDGIILAIILMFIAIVLVSFSFYRSLRAGTNSVR